MSSQRSLNEKVVLITGGAAGIGAEVAGRLYEKGAKLVLVDVDEDALTRSSAAFAADRLLAVKADVRSLEDMQAVANDAVAKFGGIDVVIANAGIASYGSVSQVDPAAFKRVIDINVLGVFHTVRTTLPSVIERRGYVLIVSSLAAYAAAPGLAAYCSTKAAVEQFASSLRLEVAYRGVAVGSAHMSWVDTAMVRDTKSDLSTFGELLSKLPVPLNRTTSVADCGKAFIRGIEGRKRIVNCPGWVGVMRWFKPLLSTPIGMAPVLRVVPDVLPRMDAEVAALGRSTNAQSDALEKAAVALAKNTKSVDEE